MLEVLIQHFFIVQIEASTKVFVELADAIEVANGKIGQIGKLSNDSMLLNQNTEEQINRMVEQADNTIQISKGIYKNVESLGEEVSNIEGVVTLIADINVQTNLLALNAMIEAARSRESEKGFAVVAQEMSKLAARTNEAIKEIFAKALLINKKRSITMQKVTEAIDTFAMQIPIVDETKNTFLQFSR